MKNRVLQYTLFTIILLMAPLIVSAGEISVTTYYPAPLGNFKRLKVDETVLLNPQPTKAEPCEFGHIYFDSVFSDIRFCDDSLTWTEPDKVWRLNSITTEVFLKNWATVNGVGIGISNPATMLDVASLNAIKVGEAYLSSASGSSLILANRAWFDGAWNFTGNGALIALMSNQELRFYRHSGGAFTRTMTISANGRVGIGTVSFNQRLRVDGGGGRVYVALDPTSARHISTKAYDDIPPTLQTITLLASANCPNFATYGGTNGTQLRICHGINCSPHVTVSQVYCNPINP